MLLGQEVPPVKVVEETCDSDDGEEDGNVHESDSQHETTEEEPDFSSDGCYEPDETDTASESEEDVDISGDRYMFFTSYHLELM